MPAIEIAVVVALVAAARAAADDEDGGRLWNHCRRDVLVLLGLVVHVVVAITGVIVSSR